MADQPGVKVEPSEDKELEELFSSLGVEEEKPGAEPAAGPESPTGKEPEGTGASAPVKPAAQPREEYVPKSRFDEVNKDAELARKHKAVLERLESDPDAARRFLAEPVQEKPVVPEDTEYDVRKLYTPPAREQAPAPAPQAPQQTGPRLLNQQELEEYWSRRFQDNPALAAAEIAALKAQEAAQQSTAATRISNLNKMVRDQVKDYERDEPEFKYYKKIFVDTLKTLPPETIEANPDVAFERTRDYAYGKWVRAQRDRMRGAKTLPRERPAEPISRGAGEGDATPTRTRGKVTEEQMMIAQRYGLDPNDLAEEGETETSPWGRM